MSLQTGAQVWVRVGPKSLILCEFARRRDCDGPTCGAEILWCKTPEGKWMPVSTPADGDEDGAAEFEPHWADCPDRERFRNAKGAT